MRRKGYLSVAVVVVSLFYSFSVFALGSWEVDKKLTLVPNGSDFKLTITLHENAKRFILTRGRQLKWYSRPNPSPGETASYLFYTKNPTVGQKVVLSGLIKPKKDVPDEKQEKLPDLTVWFVKYQGARIIPHYKFIDGVLTVNYELKWKPKKAPVGKITSETVAIKLNELDVTDKFSLFDEDDNMGKGIYKGIEKFHSDDPPPTLSLVKGKIICSDPKYIFNVQNKLK